uniref:Uncharacterized protein n=1 Tax=Panagrolaimus davidi TaxID=227884 RepID=A0A914R166_9BILA
MTCSQGIFDMHLNNMPNESFTDKISCAPSPNLAYYFWNNIKNKDNLYNVTVCKMKQFTRSRRNELFCNQIMLGDVNCNDTYADEEHDSQESTNFPATWYNASTTHFYDSILPSTETSSTSHNVVKPAATLEDNNDKLFWIVTAIIIILIGVIVHLIVCVCRYKHKYQCEKLRKQSVYYAVDDCGGLCETTKRLCRQLKNTTIDGVDGEGGLLKNSLNCNEPHVNQNGYTEEHPMINEEPAVDTDTK